MRESNEAIRLYERKLAVIDELESILGRESIVRARRDSHAKRRPRPCGMTIHPGVGCVRKCLYCYLPDMGIKFSEVSTYPLSGTELAYALAVNPYVVPERTLAAFGSITEPFLPATTERTIEYLREVRRWLKLPSQVSTKSVLSPEVSRELSLADKDLSVLVTVVTLSKHRVLEPNAPDPVERMRGGEVASRTGLRVDLFLRPIIPGVTEDDVPKILLLARKFGFRGVVVGSLRVTKGIVSRLEEAGLLTSKLRSRLPKKLSSKRQISIDTSDIKELVKVKARELGLDFFTSACMPNVISHGIYCMLCDFGPCGCGRIDSDRIVSEVEEFLDYLGVKGSANLIGRKILINARLRNTHSVKHIDLEHFISDTYKIRVQIRRG